MLTGGLEPRADPKGHCHLPPERRGSGPTSISLIPLLEQSARLTLTDVGMLQQPANTSLTFQLLVICGKRGARRETDRKGWLERCDRRATHHRAEFMPHPKVTEGSFQTPSLSGAQCCPVKLRRTACLVIHTCDVCHCKLLRALI